MKKLATLILASALMVPAHSALSEGEAALIGIGIGAVLSERQAQPVYVQPQPVYVQPQPYYVPRPVYVQPQPFIYGTVPGYQVPHNHRHINRGVMIQMPNGQIYIQE